MARHASSTSRAGTTITAVLTRASGTLTVLMIRAVFISSNSSGLSSSTVRRLEAYCETVKLVVRTKTVLLPTLLLLLLLLLRKHPRRWC